MCHLLLYSREKIVNKPWQCEKKEKFSPFSSGQHLAVKELIMFFFAAWHYSVRAIVHDMIKVFTEIITPFVCRADCALKV